MRILHVITSLQTGGAEKLVTDMLPRLRDLGLDAELAVFSGEMTPFMQKLLTQSIKIHRFNEKGENVYSPSNLFKLIKLIRKGRYDIVHSHNTAPQLFGALASLVSDSHFVTTEHSTSNRRRNLRWFKPIDRFMFSRYEKVVCISDKALDSLNEYIGSNQKNCVIYNGVDIQAFNNPINDINTKDSFVITMVAGLRFEKDQDTIIRALALLPTNFTLKLVGDGSRRSELESLAVSLHVADRVEFTGVRSDIPEQLRSSDFVIMSSHYEGLSLSSVEGMASGRPFIASDVPGLHEVVDGAGILFPHGDSDALANILLGLSSDSKKYSAVASACQNRANQYDITNTIEGYINLYNYILAK